ncbi:MAG: glycogen debranching protein GlgX [Chloroflexi bacterium]|nr:glycogen debranching protein GlgX [Chloroflexota bacterium]
MPSDLLACLGCRRCRGSCGRPHHRATTADVTTTDSPQDATSSRSVRTVVAESSGIGPPFAVEAGSPHPLGATPDAEGVNFSIFSQNATSIELLLFAAHTAVEPFQVVPLDPARHRTFHFWHAYLRGLRPGVQYAYRVNGPHDLHGLGQRFNPNKILLDPYAKGVTTTLWQRADACTPDDNLATSMRSVVIDHADYDWEGDRPLKRPMAETIVYELHVGGFTKSPTSGVAHPGTFAGLIEKIPYLQALGITAVELMPATQFDPADVAHSNPVDGTPLVNFWGYSPVAFFAPHDGYCVSPDQATHIRELRDLVKALHRAGLEVILDVVFNHTTEGNHLGPTIGFRGLENSIYYHLDPADRARYLDYSGCGNTVNCNHPIVDKLIVECLEFWVREVHVDGFRFDEGSILSRGEDGVPMVHPPVVWHIELSEELADTKIIAEAWDAAGLYQIGNFPGGRWAEWNGRYRDDIRRFVRGDPGIVGTVASRIAGSSDLYAWDGSLPINSVNFITCHDGFTLYDLVSYNWKHNEANGEGNHDGLDDNLSWNCGAEGPTDVAAIETLRRRQIANFVVILLLSQGVPILLAGDEVRRTQCGNNNAYCQDNEVSWLDWALVDEQADLLRFFREAIAFRKRHPVLQRRRFFTGALNSRGLRDIDWHGFLLNEPGWFDPGSHVLAFTLGGLDGDADLHVMLNMDPSALDFEIPVVKGRRWLRAIDTSLASPNDIAVPGDETPVSTSTYQVASHSVVVLIST